MVQHVERQTGHVGHQAVGDLGTTEPERCDHHRHCVGRSGKQGVNGHLERHRRPAFPGAPIQRDKPAHPSGDFINLRKTRDDACALILMLETIPFERLLKVRDWQRRGEGTEVWPHHHHRRGGAYGERPRREEVGRRVNLLNRGRGRVDRRVGKHPIELIKSGLKVRFFPGGDRLHLGSTSGREAIPRDEIEQRGRTSEAPLLAWCTGAGRAHHPLGGSPFVRDTCGHTKESLGQRAQSKRHDIGVFAIVTKADAKQRDHPRRRLNHYRRRPAFGAQRGHEPGREVQRLGRVAINHHGQPAPFAHVGRTHNGVTLAKVTSRQHHRFDRIGSQQHLRG